MSNLVCESGGEVLTENEVANGGACPCEECDDDPKGMCDDCRAEGEGQSCGACEGYLCDRVRIAECTRCEMQRYYQCCDGNHGPCCEYDDSDVENACPCGTDMLCCPEARRRLVDLLPRLQAAFPEQYAGVTQPCQDCYQSLLQTK